MLKWGETVRNAISPSRVFDSSTSWLGEGQRGTKGRRHQKKERGGKTHINGGAKNFHLGAIPPGSLGTKSPRSWSSLQTLFTDLTADTIKIWKFRTTRSPPDSWPVCFTTGDKATFLRGGLAPSACLRRHWGWEAAVCSTGFEPRPTCLQRR